MTVKAFIKFRHMNKTSCAVFIYMGLYFCYITAHIDGQQELEQELVIKKEVAENILNKEE